MYSLNAFWNLSEPIMCDSILRIEAALLYEILSNIADTSDFVLTA